MGQKRYVELVKRLRQAGISRLHVDLFACPASEERHVRAGLTSEARTLHSLVEKKHAAISSSSRSVLVFLASNAYRTTMRNC